MLLVWGVNLASLLNKRHQSWTIHVKQILDGISEQANREICTTESRFFTNKSYNLVVLLCKGSAKIYNTLQQEQETHVCFCKPCIGLTKSQPQFGFTV